MTVQLVQRLAAGLHEFRFNEAVASKLSISRWSDFREHYRR